MKSGDWRAYLIFDTDTGHWYDVTDSAGNSYNGMTNFDDTSSDATAMEIKKLEEFKKTYFIPERMVD